MAWLSDPQAWLALLALTSIEIVLGIFIFCGDVKYEDSKAPNGTGQAKNKAAIKIVKKMLLRANKNW